MAQSPGSGTPNQGANYRNSSEGSGDGVGQNSAAQNSGVIRPDGQQRGSDFWTSGRMQEAAPKALPKVDPNAVRRANPN